MTVDLTALDAANKALQADSKAAKTVKVFAAEATKVLHAMTTTQPVPPQPQPIPPSTSNPVPPPNTGALWGAYIEGAKTNAWYYPTGVPWSNAPMVDAGTSDSWAKFESDAGKKVALLMFGGGGPDPWLKPFAAQQVYLDLVVARGAIPVLDVSTGNTPLTDYTSGKQDAQITAWAKGAAAWGKSFVFRLDCEMNGHWYDYGIQAQKNPASFIAMWRHFHDLFKAAGADNVSWHWCPNIDPDRVQTPLENLYPGDAYVDWTGMTGYNHGNELQPGYLWDGTYNRLVNLSRLPIMLGEIGSVDSGFTGDKIKFIDDLLGAMIKGTYPQIKAFCWFNWRIDEGQGFWDWPIQSSATALAHFKSVIANKYFVGRA